MLRHEDHILAPQLAAREHLAAVQRNAAVHNVQEAVARHLARREDHRAERDGHLHQERLLRLLEEPHLAQPARIDRPRDLAEQLWRHHREEAALRRRGLQMPRLMEVLSQARAHLRRQALQPHEAVQIVHRPPELRLFRIDGRDHAAERRNHVAPRQRRDEHQQGGDHLLLGIDRHNVAVADRCDRGDGPVGAARPYLPMVPAHDVGQRRVVGVGAVGPAEALVADPCFELRVVHYLGLQPPQAAEPVREQDDVEAAPPERERAVVYRHLRLEALGDARRAHEPHELDEPKHTQHTQHLELGEVAVAHHERDDVEPRHAHGDHVQPEPPLDVVLRDHPPVAHPHRRRACPHRKHEKKLQHDVEAEDDIDRAVDHKERVDVVSLRDERHLVRRDNGREYQRQHGGQVPSVHPFRVARVDDALLRHGVRMHVDRGHHLFLGERRLCPSKLQLLLRSLRNDRHQCTTTGGVDAAGSLARFCIPRAPLRRVASQ
mmetsp:Transcript_46284/g.128663  ORF Transcript_46284/g.128663 Transcript_46284/m.128663 type:complete len:490 (+) Transcript_46284:1278-2747(+)